MEDEKINVDDLANDSEIISHIKKSRKDREEGKVYSGEAALLRLREKMREQKKESHK